MGKRAERNRSAMRVGEIMRRHVEWARPDTSALEAARVMRDENIGALPICDDEMRVIGIVTDRDLAVRVCAEARDAAATTVREVMTPDAITCRPDHTVGNAEALMAEHRVSRLFVVDDGKLAGVLSLSDIAQYESPQHIARTYGAISQRKYRPESP